MATAVITGGSQGLGFEFARALAAEGYNLILIARGIEQLKAASNDIVEHYNVKVRVLSVDLSDTTSIEVVTRAIARVKDLAVMVNNAGFAVHIDAGDNSKKAYSLQRSAFDVMAFNTLLFSSAAATAMKKQGMGRIINVASTSAWLLNGNYSAIKSYVLVYTQSLALELKGTGVTATVVCPSWMHTNFHKDAKLKEPAIPEWLYMKPSDVVSAALNGSAKGKIVVVPTIRWKVIIWLMQHGPVALRQWATRAYQNSGNYKK